MSDQTRKALEQAIQAHIQDENPDDTPGAWILITEALNDEDLDNDSAAWHTTSHGSPLTIRGLLETELDRQRENTGERDS